MYLTPLKLSVSILVFYLSIPASMAMDSEGLKGGNPDHGKRLYNQCKACHSLTDSDRKRIGPTLHGIFGRQAGTVEGYKYSAALAESDIQWTPEHLNEWLAKPNAYLPGNKMPYAGMRDAQDRKDLIAYLEKATVSLPNKDN